MRYGVSGLAYRMLGVGFPWGTLCVNLTGSLLIGFLWGMFESVPVSQNFRTLLFIGILGSFTTFSTFSIESFHLFRNNEYGLVAINITASFLLGIALAFAGYFMSRYIFNITQ